MTPDAGRNPVDRDRRARPARASIAASLAVILATFSAHRVIAHDAAKPPGSSSQDLLFLGVDRPLIIRVDLEVDGRPHDEIWRDSIRELFAQADADHDGKLSTGEIQSPTPAESTLRDELLALLSSPGLPQCDVNPPDGMISIEEFTALAEQSRGGAFQAIAEIAGAPVRNGAPPSAQASGSGTILFTTLDQNDDGRLSPSEIENGPAALRSRDFDGDGASSIDELDHTRSPFTQAPGIGGGAGAVPVIALTPQQPDRQLLDLLIRSYGAQSDRGVSGIDIAKFSIPDAEAQAYDEDGDRWMSRQELRTFLTHPVSHIHLVARIGNRPEGNPHVEIVKALPLNNVTVKSSDIGLVSVVLADVQMEISVSPRLRSVESMKAACLQRFKQLDGDANGYVDHKEAERNSAFLETFTSFDRDADGKIFEEEFTVIAEGRTRVALARTRMSPADRGKDLLEILDTNRDRRLTQREVLGAVSRFSLWDSDGDKQLAESEIPQIYQLVFDRGLPELPGLMDAMPAERVAADQPAARSGPAWFINMDRNGDGDVSRQEFLGTPPQFRKLDQDLDGLIDSEEATTASIEP